MNWLEITLTVPTELEETAADVLARFAPGGVASEAAQFEVIQEAEGRGRPSGPFTLRAYLPAETDPEELRAQLESELAQLGLPRPEYHPITETNWAENWKAHFHPVRIGRRLIVLPAWLNPPLEPELIPIRLDPGMAFGTGTHPTTQLCLAALESHVTPGQPVLDLGTGSGILAIAAAKLGAGPVLALDIDPEAVRVARENMAVNKVAGHIRVETGSLAEVLAGGFGLTSAPLVVANILAHVLIEMFQQGLAQTVTPGGALILSGILAAQAPDVTAAFTAQGLERVAQDQIEDWVVIIARRPPTA